MVALLEPAGGQVPLVLLFQVDVLLAEVRHLVLQLIDPDPLLLQKPLLGLYDLVQLLQILRRLAGVLRRVLHLVKSPLAVHGGDIIPHKTKQSKRREGGGGEQRERQTSRTSSSCSRLLTLALSHTRAHRARAAHSVAVSARAVSTTGESPPSTSHSWRWWWWWRRLRRRVTQGLVAPLRSPLLHMSAARQQHQLNPLAAARCFGGNALTPSEHGRGQPGPAEWGGRNFDARRCDEHEESRAQQVGLSDWLSEWVSGVNIILLTPPSMRRRGSSCCLSVTTPSSPPHPHLHRRIFTVNSGPSLIFRKAWERYVNGSSGNEMTLKTFRGQGGLKVIAAIIFFFYFIF